MATKREVQLVIQAKDQAEAAILSVTSALAKLKGAQEATASSADRTDGSLSRLGAELAALGNRAAGLTALAKMATQIDRAATSVDRLEQRFVAAGRTAVKFGADAARAAEATARAAEKSNAANAALQAGGEGGGSIRALQQEARAAARELRAAEKAQRGFEASAELAANAVAEQQAALAAANGKLVELRTVAGQAGGALGGVAASQSAVSDAAKRTAADIDRVNAALAKSSGQRAGGLQSGPAAEASAAFRAQNQAVAEARTRFAEAQAEATRLGAALRAAKNPAQELRTEFALAAAASKQAKREYQDQAAAANALRASTQGGFAAFEARANAIARQAEASRRAVAAETQLNSSLITTIRRLIGLKSAADGAATATQRLAATSQRAGGAARGGFLGLRPYELQNLSFQINDVFTQIASGTSVTQTLAQQGGQIVQIFPKAAVAVFRMLPAIGAVTAVIVPFIAAFRRITEVESSVKTFGTELALSADGANNNADAMARAAQGLDRYKGSIDDARTSVSAFVKEGVNPEAFERLGRAAANVAGVIGKDIPEAAEDLAKAFTGGYDAVKELDDQLNFLTVSERDHIRAMFDSGKESEARAAAFAIFERKAQDVATKSEGPWSRAAQSLGRSWNIFLDAISNTGIIQAFRSGLDSLSQGAMRFAKNLEISLAFLTGGRDAAFAAIRAQRGIGQGNQPAIDPQAAIETERRKKEEQDKLLEEQKKAAEDAAREAKQRADQAAREAEALRKRQQEFVAGIDAENEARKFTAGILNETALEQKILQEIREKELAAQALGLQLSQQQRDAIRETITLEEQRRKEIEATKAIEDAQARLRAALGQELTRDEHVANELRRAGIDELTEQGEAYAEIVGRIFEIEAAEKRRADGLKAHNDAMNAAFELERDRADLIFRIEEAQARGESQKADALNVRLAATNDALTGAVAKARELALALDDKRALDALDAINERVAQLTVGSERVKQLNQEIASGLASVGVTLGEELGKAADNAQSLGDAFAAAGNAFRQFVADFLKRIAQAIAQQAIFNALQNASKSGGAMGGFFGLLAGAVGTNHGGGMAGSGPKRMVDARWFQNAQRFHNGGFPGLRQNEVPAILKAGEEVLTENDPRHARNGGRGASPEVRMRNINIVDGPQVLQHALGSYEGEKVFINYIRANAHVIRGALDV